VTSRSATLRKGGPGEFGWLLRGKAIAVLPDRSFDLAARSDGSFLEPYCQDVATLRSCLQCGACTATCDLAGDEGLFPRRQLTFVRLGLQDPLVADREIWHCYGCTECSSKCPSGANPATIMSALRQFTTERFACPGVVARLVNSRRYFWLAYGAVAALLAVMVAAAGAFSPGPGPLTYAGMLPDAVLIPVFCALTVLPLLAVGVGAGRAWRCWYGVSLRTVRPRVFARSVTRAVAEILAHRKFSTCKERRLRPWAHRAVLFSFIGLAGVSGVMALLILLGRSYPLSMGNPVKVLGDVFAAFLIGGTCYFLALRIVDTSPGKRGSLFDWVFLLNVLLAGVTGVVTEALRAADARGAAYPVYFIHLVVVLVLIGTLPYTKLAHAVYRVLAVAGRDYEQVLAAEPGLSGFADGTPAGSGAPRITLVGDPQGPADMGPLSSEAFLGLGHEELAAMSDDAIFTAYYGLRDVSEPRSGGRYYPNVKRLAGTAFEREKDRREIRALVREPEKTEWQAFYESASEESCTWWVDHHLVARHALTSCLSCGMCTSVCPAAEHFEEYDPRVIVDTVLSRDEDRFVALLKSDVLWYCAQCGSCNSRCPHENDVMGLVGSLRTLAQLKGYHLESVRGRQQYAGRHLWAGNLWNRAFSLYFRNLDPAEHPDFGPRYARWQAELEEQSVRVGGQPDMEGTFAGRKVTPETLSELRSCIRAGGALVVWDKLESHAENDAARRGLDIDQYHAKVNKEG
jgi:quinone-modifying oxidoreductase subunit QmoC